jgi:peptidoglycan hydrolase CwlO-like protein
MLRSNAGKARISIVWMVTVGVLFLVALAFAFIAQSDLTTEKQNVTGAQAKVTEMATQVDALAEARRNLSTALGWYDRTSADPQADPAAAKKALEDLKGTFPDLGAAEKDFETAIPKILAAYNERGRKLAELETRIKGLESEVAAAQGATAQVTTEKDATIASLRQQMADEQKNADQRVAELESRLEQSRTQLSERDSEVRKTRDDAGQEKRKFEAQKAIDDARMAQLSNDTAFARDPYWKEPDGRVLEVSAQLGSGWIDIGANQRVVRGIVFEVRSGRPGDTAVKAYAEVTDVKSNSAEVQFTGIADRFSPPVAGDVVANRLYDPVGGRNAVLVGRFSGAYNEKDLKTLLDKMGIQVQPKVDKTTHFLIVGSEMWNDPDTGEPLTEPRQPSDLPEYKQAEALHVQIIPLQDIREHFRLGAGQ